MSNEELMELRIEVMGGYPGSPFSVGQILYYQNNEFVNNRYHKGNPNKEPCFKSIAIAKAREYPNLFKELAWWEKREIGDIQYVKHGTEIRKVKELRLEKSIPEVACALDIPFGNYDREWFAVYDCLPATQSEYEQYLKTKSA